MLASETSEMWDIFTWEKDDRKSSRVEFFCAHWSIAALLREEDLLVGGGIEVNGAEKRESRTMTVTMIPLISRHFSNLAIITRIFSFLREPCEPRGLTISKSVMIREMIKTVIQDNEIRANVTRAQMRDCISMNKFRHDRCGGLYREAVSKVHKLPK